MNVPARIANRCRDLLFLPALDGVWRSRRRSHLLCLRYPRVDEPGRLPFLDRLLGPPITPTDLLDDLVFLSMQGARFLTFSDLRRGRFPRPEGFGVIVVFDQGLRQDYFGGLGVIEWLGARAVVAQATPLLQATTLIAEHALVWHAADPARAERLRDLAHATLPASRSLQGDALLRHLRTAEPKAALEALLAELAQAPGAADRLEELAAELYPRAEHLRSARMSHHEIAVSAHHHDPRSGADDESFEAELAASSALITQITGRRPSAFVYPHHGLSAADLAICARHYQQVIHRSAAPITPDTPALELPGCRWPGPPRSALRRRRWLWRGRI